MWYCHPTNDGVTDMLIVEFRGKSYFRLSSIKAKGPGRVEAVRDGAVYRIEGGRTLGGSRSEWFLSGPEFSSDIPCKSVADALNLLENL